MDGIAKSFIRFLWLFSSVFIFRSSVILFEWPIVNELFREVCSCKLVK